MKPQSSASVVGSGSEHLLPRVTVIVPVFNGEATLKALLEALDSQSYPRDRLQVLIADDASTDGTSTLLERSGKELEVVKLLGNSGSYAARNAALSKSRGQVIAFTDADCQPDANWLEQGVRALHSKGGGLVAGAVSIEPVDSRSVIQCYDQAFGIQQAFFASRQHFGATANLFVDYQVFEKVSGFDEQLRSGGDKAFCDACTAAGLSFSYAPDCRVRHAPRTSLHELVVKQKRVALGHVRIYPLWSLYRLVPLSMRPRESFDYSTFCRDTTPWFRWRFRATYYWLELVYLATYVRGCLGQNLRRVFA
ncbi:MAG: glycosyltransferase [Ketobacter sp.]|nr:glycosyltransferase [Ketobacter sp.]